MLGSRLLVGGAGPLGCCDADCHAADVLVAMLPRSEGLPLDDEGVVVKVSWPCALLC